MTPEEACFYLADAMREDTELRAALLARIQVEGYADVYAWAEAEPEQCVMIAESWQDVVGQTPPGLDPL